MNLLVSEIFYSIQGEGPNVGKPAVFLRLFGCNLKCKWCDSKYAILSPQRKLGSTSSTVKQMDSSLRWNDKQEISITQILKQIRKFDCKHLVLTGGEPLLQQDGLAELLEELPDYYVEVETNGSIPLKIGKHISHINCSPKLINSGNKPYSLAIKPSNRKAVYKFVVRHKSSADLKEVKQFISSNEIPKNRAWLMPEGTSRTKITEASKWLVEVCKKEGFNFSPRLHVMLWGNKRAV